MYTKTLSAVTEDDLAQAGRRATDLAELRKHKLAVPESFVVLATALDAVIEENKLKPKLDFLHSHLDSDDKRSLTNLYTSVRKQFGNADIPDGILDDLREMYESISAGGIGLEGKTQPVRVILSTTGPEDPESNDTVIQNVRDWEEFLTALREAWALAWHPGQHAYRIQRKYDETRLKVAVLVQAMEPADVSVHAHSAMPEDDEKVYLEVYQGLPDLRGKVTKDYYAVTKDQLEIVLSEVRKQPHKLVTQGEELLLSDLPDAPAEDKLIPREVEETARLTKKAERLTGSPVKCFFTYHDEQFSLLWVNRLPLAAGREQPAGEVEIVDIPDVAVTPEDDDGKTLNEALEEASTTPEKEFADASHAAEEAIMEAVEEPEDETETLGEGNKRLLASSLHLAMRTIIKKYEETFGQEGDDFYDMIDELNAEEAFGRSIDAELLRIAHNMVEHGLEISPEDYEGVVREITFIMET